MSSDPQETLQPAHVWYLHNYSDEQLVAELQRRGSRVPLTFARMREANVNRCREAWHDEKDWSPTDWACAMAGECGEACNEVKKLRRLQDGNQPTPGAPAGEHARQQIVEQIGLELADMVLYADLLAAALDIDLAWYIQKKFNLVSNRVGSPRRL